ncbi:MAG TPA: DNA repair protein RecN [Candidatus Caccoplasma intestinavium]|uniref:DNA repair protein RecN n=1 Tax=Candidatus Caccoplasma intestinavium TaxID=2840716 RepID=A0A9D1GCM4_9BACT|nr:DNA repair protein RecN [Candidatus Caccoplasma intestinavium]
MIQRLFIRNYALIDSLEIDFRPGFTVLTGETGAGKSIILGALSLILGQRADSKAIKDAAQKTVIEGTFDVSAYEMRSFFEENDLDYEPSGICILRRELSPAGKSRAFVNDTPVSLTVLKELGEQLIDIHSQHQNLLLGDNRFQLRMIDIWAGDESLLSQYRTEYKRYCDLRDSLDRLRRASEENRKEEDYLRFQYDQLCEARLQPGEQSLLEDEQEMLTHAGEIKNALYSVAQYLGGDEGGALLQMKECQSVLRSLLRIYSAVEPLSERIESAYIEMKDILGEIENRQETVSVDPIRLQEVESRLDLIYGLQQKHHVSTIDELLSLQADLQQRLEAIDHSDEQITELQRKLSEQEKSLHTLAERLSAARHEASVGFTEKLIERARPLGMPHLRFEVEWKSKEGFDADGTESVRYLFSANKNRPMESVADIASGGEISRLMLTIKSLAADAAALPTIIFDEIDTGVSGEIADKMGEIMAGMAHYMQVVAITHLPQVASRGEYHYRIYKNDEGETTQTCIEPLDDTRRAEEIARMLSGTQLTEAALKNARELLNRK